MVSIEAVKELTTVVRSVTVAAPKRFAFGEQLYTEMREWTV